MWLVAELRRETIITHKAAYLVVIITDTAQLSRDLLHKQPHVTFMRWPWLKTQLIQVVVVAAAVAVVAFHYYLPLSANAELYFLVWRHFHITPVKLQARAWHTRSRTSNGGPNGF